MLLPGHQRRVLASVQAHPGPCGLHHTVRLQEVAGAPSDDQDRAHEHEGTPMAVRAVHQHRAPCRALLQRPLHATVNLRRRRPCAMPNTALIGHRLSLVRQVRHIIMVHWCGPCKCCPAMLHCQSSGFLKVLYHGCPISAGYGRAAVAACGAARMCNPGWLGCPWAPYYSWQAIPLDT